MVVWSEPAKEDLKIIHDYIYHDSPFYAQQVITNIIEKTETLINFPETGRIVPEINNSNTREIFIYSYRIIYEIINNDIIIHAVIHGKRDFNKAFKSE
jgi:toxin ParE1/3/4